MTQRWGLWGGLALFVVLLLMPAPDGMPDVPRLEDRFPPWGPAAGLLTAMGPIPLGWHRVAGPLAGGYLGNTVLPGRLGEVVRIVLVNRRTGEPVTQATASVVVERAVVTLPAVPGRPGAAYFTLRSNGDRHRLAGISSARIARKITS